MLMFYIKNLVSHNVDKVDPTIMPLPNTHLKKSDFVRLAQTVTFNHYFISCVEGLIPQKRVCSSNPPHYLHGFLVDYDGLVTEADILKLHTRVNPNFPPAYWCQTRSGGARLLWEFERPLLWQDDSSIMKMFFRSVSKAFRLDKLLPGLDENWCEPTMYFDIGLKWEKLSDAKIHRDVLNEFLFKASNASRQYRTEFSEIPLDIIEAEVHKRFPNRWKGPFREGARGVRFWDPLADNPTAAVVRKTGMQCFTGPKPFVRWEEIFGRNFLEMYTRKKEVNISNNIYYDGKNYWYKISDGWKSYSKEDIKMLLKTKYGISSRPKDGEIASELEKVLTTINEMNRIDFAAPLIHYYDGLMAIDNKKVLNIWNGKVLQPISLTAGDTLEWGMGFEFIADFLDCFFFDDTQKNVFLTWLKLFYEGGLNRTPRPGQAMVIAGDVGVGKTLLATAIVGPLVGGCADASNYIFGETPFTAYSLSAPLMLLDDTTPAESPQKYNKYTTMIKKIVSNRVFRYDQKYEKAGSIVWNGRIMILCNLDVLSLRMLPSFDISVFDKLIFLKCQSRRKEFPSPDELRETLDKELPYFAAWLLRYNPPENIKDNSRFGMKSYHDISLRLSAISNSPSATFFEVLELWREEYCKDKAIYDENYSVRMTAAELLSSMSEYESLKTVIKNFTPESVGKYLQTLSSRGYPFKLVRDGTARRWEIFWTKKGFPMPLEGDNTFSGEDTNLLPDGNDESAFT